MAGAMEGKAALITGGARGLGREFAEILLQNGANVCIIDVLRQPGLETQRNLQRKYGVKRVHFVLADCTNAGKVEAAINETIQRFGGLDILVNNAAISAENNFRRAIDVNLTAVIQNSMLGLKYMGKAAGRSGANIVNIASVAGFLPSPQVPIYTTVKHGVVAFSRSLGMIGPRLYNIRVNALCPTFADTVMMRGSGNPDAVFDGKTELAEWFSKRPANIGIMTPREVAESFLDLLKNEKLSGQIYYVSPNAKGPVRMPRTLEDAERLCKL